MPISEADAKALEDLGYLRIENGISSDTLTRWRTLADRLEAEAVTAHHAGTHAEGCCVVEVRGDARAYRVEDVLYRDADAVLDLLASPGLLEIADRLCGPGTVSLTVDIVYKHPYPYPHIIWHQGASHPRTHPFLNIGVHLDDSDAGDGCLRYVPRTQHELLDIGEISGTYGWNPPGVVEVPSKAGDILVQDMMVLHASEPKRTPGARRTVYLEFWPAEGLRVEGVKSEYWIRLREQLMALAHDRARPEDRPKGWTFDHVERRPIDELVADIKANRERPTPAHYATFPVDHPEYPTPSDLRHLDP